VWDEPYDQESIERYSEHEERVLIVVVPRARDWERLQTEHWYRIPVKRAPSRVGVDYLAFYHTSVFADLRWTITYYAPVRRYRIVRRVDLLPDEETHPRAQDLYYKVEIGRLQRLSRPIVSRRLRRVTFIATTMSRLLRAREINDLWDRETPRERLQDALSVREDRGLGEVTCEESAMARGERGEGPMTLEMGRTKRLSRRGP